MSKRKPAATVSKPAPDLTVQWLDIATVKPFEKNAKKHPPEQINKLARQIEEDLELLSSDLLDLKTSGLDITLSGFDDFGFLSLGTGNGKGGDDPDGASIGLQERFGVPPFSVLDSRQGYWIARRRAWLAKGIESEKGRAENLLKFSAAAQSGYGRSPNDAWAGAGTSIFDPVLCEIAYRWFSGPNAQVLDPFAGGSVRGLMAAFLGRRYLGVDLRQEQIEENRKQLAQQKLSSHAPQWLCGDSLDLAKLLPSGFEADFIFSCPPYADLEVYSDDQKDISTMPYAAFREAYAAIISQSVARLRKDRFAMFVVSEVREKKGHGRYRGFVADTIAAFEAAGAAFYNEAILVNSLGSSALRASRIFLAGRKMLRTHQNVLVFCKGDPRKATEAAGPIDLSLVEELVAAEQADGSQLSSYGEVLTEEDL